MTEVRQGPTPRIHFREVSVLTITVFTNIEQEYCTLEMNKILATYVRIG